MNSLASYGLTPLNILRIVVGWLGLRPHYAWCPAVSLIPSNIFFMPLYHPFITVDKIEQ